MSILISVIISGMAVAYTTEFISSIGEKFFNPRTVKLVLTLPLAIFASWLLGLTGFVLAVASPAAGFFSLATLQLLNRPVNIQTVTRR
ncbi:hypothetical protein UFOVP223_112 [uncultured Caudovirales phage]|uniref:Uncharacterized protein n=1 Tax=uncultured Caudovirales phage TaxID=2100421 RepID=A0A6J7WP35_9CAUD|nr:hypothetical protein UFOVP110_52 [uncultured Caudovirales phage]CAB5219666.1 hypothetical protein UFOVP223_112 [uncultured Caudovirales phage]